MENRFELRYFGVGLTSGMIVGAVIGFLLGGWLAVGGMMGSETPAADLIFLPLFGVALGGVSGALPGILAGLTCAFVLPRIGNDGAYMLMSWLLGAAATLVGLVVFAALSAAAGAGLILSWPGVVIFGVIAGVPMGWMMARTTHTLRYPPLTQS